MGLCGAWRVASWQAGCAPPRGRSGDGSVVPRNPSRCLSLRAGFCRVVVITFTTTHSYIPYTTCALYTHLCSSVPDVHTTYVSILSCICVCTLHYTALCTHYVYATQTACIHHICTIYALCIHYILHIQHTCTTYTLHVCCDPPTL